ncbi:P-loop containing nucleoside triphosphate hydrolase protein, partial [Athelia psychrophila]
AQWRSSAQRALLVETLDMRSDVLAILPTNGGKSMAYIVPSIVEGGYTAAVIPLKSLMADTERKLRDMGVDFEKYRKGQSIGGEAKLILVSIENARTPEWRKAISELDNRVPDTRVSRIVIDEAHFAFTASDFRDALRNLKEMRTHSMQFVLLSATIPPQSENHV